MLSGNQTFRSSQAGCRTTASGCPVYLLPRLLPAGGFLSCRRGPLVPKAVIGWLETPKVRPAEGLMPGLLKLNPELLLPPKPGKREKRK